MSEDRVSLVDIWQSPKIQMPHQTQSLHEIAVSIQADDPENILSRIEHYVRRYCILPEAAYLPHSIWCLATYLTECFDSFPYLAILSPMPRCGKTRLLEILELLSKNAWRGVAPTPASTYRMMETNPTLLLDEVEALIAGNKVSEAQQALLSILNAGYRKGATVPRCDGNNHKLIHFPVYGPKAFAAIGSLPGTLMDRSIVVHMQRKTRTQKAERFRQSKAIKEAEPIKTDVELWAGQHGHEVETAYQDMDDLEFLTDRDPEIWSPLFAICAVAEPDRVPELRQTALTLSGAKQDESEEESTALRLLGDICSVWPQDRPHIFSSDLLEKLRGIDESPWLEYNLTQRGLANKLRPFGISSRTIRNGAVTAKGYIREEFEAAWARYLAPPPSCTQNYPSHATQPAETLAATAFLEASQK